MKIKQIYHIGLPCNDLERATKFYTDVLGMKCTKVGFDTESGGPYDPVASVTTTEWIDVEVKKGKMYHYAVTAENPLGASFPSSEVSVRVR